MRKSLEMISMAALALMIWITWQALLGTAAWFIAAMRRAAHSKSGS